MFIINDYILCHIYDKDHNSIDGLISFDPNDEANDMLFDVLDEHNIAVEVAPRLDGVELDGFEWFEYDLCNFFVHNDYCLDADYFEDAFAEFNDDDGECDGDCDNCLYMFNIDADDGRDFDGDKFAPYKITLEELEGLLKEYNIGGRHDR